MLKRYVHIIVIAIFVLVSTSALESKVNVYETENEVRIHINGLSPELVNIDTLQVLSFENESNYLVTNSEFSNSFSFTIALASSSPNMTYKVITEKRLSIENFKNSEKLAKQYSLTTNPNGISRGIEVMDLIFQPFRYDDISKTVFYADSVEIIAEFNNKTELSTEIFSSYDEVFFSSVVNQKQLQTLFKIRDLTKGSKISEEFLKSDWYKPDFKYARIETSKDAIAKFNISDISNILPELVGKKSKYLHLIHNGEEYPYLMLNDDGYLSLDDEIIFYGRRAVGDSTWFDSYANFETFFVSYDESSEGVRMSEMNVPNQNELPFLKSVEIDRHYEQDKIYGIGSEFDSKNFDGTVAKSFFYDTRTIMGEGWFWDVIAPQEFGQKNIKSIFNYDVLIAPSDLAEDKLTVSLWYRINQDSIARENLPTVSTYFDLRMSINGNEKSRDSLMGYHFRGLNYSAPTINFNNGLNNIQVESKQVYIETNERANIDYITIKGMVKPIAFEDNLDFMGNQSNMKLSAKGFISNELMAFDISNFKFKEFKSTQTGVLFRLGANLGETSQASIGINDSIIKLSQEGIHVFSSNLSNSSFQYRYFSGNDNAHNSYVNSFPNGEAIAILVFSKSTITSDYSSISSLGSNLINNYKSGKVYAGAFIKGVSEFVEKVADNSSGFTNFISDASGNRYSYDLALESKSNSKFLISGNSKIEHIERISAVNFSNLRQSGKLDAVFISHSNFIDQAERLADYRRQTLGMKIEVVDVEDIYKEFAYGRKTPHAIKEFLKYYYDKRGLIYVLLVGDASWDSRKVLANSVSTNYVPTYGYPVSDWWFACLDGEDDIKPELVIGRLPVNSPTQANNYIDKVIEYENVPEAPWMKNVLFLIGGYDKREINIFSNVLYTHYLDYLLNPEFCGKYSTVIKDVDGPSTSFQGGIIRENINNGALWTIYIGHAAAEIFDLDGWSANSLNNKGRYGLLTTISCNTGAYAEPQLIASRNEQLILEKDKGFVTATGGSFSGFLQAHNIISSRMIQALADTSKKMRFIGDLLVYGKANLTSIYFDQLSTLHTFSLLGDPLVRARVGTEPDAFLPESKIEIVNQDNNNRFSDKDDYVELSGSIYNYGYCFHENIDLRIIRDYNLKSDTIHTNFEQLCYFDVFSFNFDIKNMPGRHKFTIEADPSGKVAELSKSNNKLVLNIDVFKEGLLNLDPQMYWDISAVNPTFRLINPFESQYDFGYNFLITTSNDTSSIVHSGDLGENADDVIVNENYIDWNPKITLEPNSYWFHARYINKTDKTWSAWSTIPVNAINEFGGSSVNCLINSKGDFELGEIQNLNLYEKSSNIELSLRRDSVEFRALSVKGNLPDNPEGQREVDPHANIEAGNLVFVDGPHDLGFNVATIKSENGELKTRYKRFETWGLETLENEFRDNTISRELVEFLRDSIENDEYVMIATCKSSFRIPYLYKMYGDEGDYGSIDSVLYYLKSFGSKIADTLVFDENFNGNQVSFAMMGWRGAEIGSIPEAINFEGDSAQIQGKFLTFSNSGSLALPPISKSKKWNKLSISALYPENGTNVELSISGINLQTGGLDTLIRATNPVMLDLNGISAKNYPELRTNIDFIQSKFDINSLLSNPETYISSIDFNFEPADELAIVKSKTTLDKTNLLRGEELYLTTTIENMNLRNQIDSAAVRINVSRSGSDNDFRWLKVENLKPSTIIELEHKIGTEFLDYTNELSVNIDPDESLIEFYRFNNIFSLPLNINRDTIKPTITLKIDGNYHKYGDYISIMPMFEIELRDNSPLQITDSNLISVRVNGYLHPYQRTVWSEFKTVNDGTNLKAILRFIPDTLQFEDASIIIYVRDNEGNADTLTTLARISPVNAYVQDVFAYPNPAREIVKFNLNFIAPEHGTEAIVEVYDISGNFIDKISQNLRLGINSIEWNGISRTSYSLPDGIYIYRVRFVGNYYIEPVFGKFVKIR